jgi:hypothetical protein
MRINPVKPLNWYHVLEVDAMYFHAARQAHARGTASLRAIDRCERRVARHEARIKALNELLREGRIDQNAHYDELEPLAIQIESLGYDVGAAYGILLGNVGTVHILSAAALEAHINIRAERFFSSGRLLQAFERLSLDAKWLLFARVRGLPGFDPGREPFQGFDRLIKTRNKLVHYKTRRELWHGSGVPPQFLVDVGLTIEAAAQSLRAVMGIKPNLRSNSACNRHGGSSTKLRTSS